MAYYYDRQGNEISMDVWARSLNDRSLQRVALNQITADCRVSTVWLGLNHNLFGTGPPLIFETMVFGGPPEIDEKLERYSTEAEAIAGHAQMCARVRQALGIPEFVVAIEIDLNKHPTPKTV